MSSASNSKHSDGLNLFRALELPSGLCLLLRSGRLVQLERKVVVNALDSCPFLMNSGLCFWLVISLSSYMSETDL